MEKERKSGGEGQANDRQEEREGGYGDAGRDRSWTGKDEEQGREQEGSAGEKRQG